MVRQLGMVEKYGVVHSSKDQLSEEENKKVDEAVQDLIKESAARVEEILRTHEVELREVAQNLFKYEYLTGEEVKNIVEGKAIQKPEPSTNSK